MGGRWRSCLALAVRPHRGLQPHLELARSACAAARDFAGLRPVPSPRRVRRGSKRGRLAEAQERAMCRRVLSARCARTSALRAEAPRLSALWLGSSLSPQRSARGARRAARSRYDRRRHPQRTPNANALDAITRNARPRRMRSTASPAAHVQCEGARRALVLSHFGCAALERLRSREPPPLRQ